eukprot:2862191-Amphidinium_carterae.1
MGLPPSVRLPFEAFVVYHKRVLALRNWAGPEINPVRGLPQGDSLSVLFAVIWGIAMHGSSGALAASEAFMLSWNIQLNVSKTTLVLSRAAREQWPPEFCGVPHLASVRLLGVEVGPSPTGFLMNDRMGVALDRLTRIRMLPLPLFLVRRLVAAFVSPVLYGVSFSVVPSARWNKLKDQ